MTTGYDDWFATERFAKFNAQVVGMIEVIAWACELSAPRRRLKTQLRACVAWGAAGMSLRRQAWRRA